VAKRIVILAALFLLMGAVSLQLVLRWREIPRPVVRPRLADSVIKSLPGWTVTNEPLGPTEVTSESVMKTLNLDDYVYRRYQRGSLSFAIYAAYWAAGRMPTRLVASHTPDRCWTENGMRCVDMGFREQLQAGGRPLLPAERRTFVLGANGTKTAVVYWHMVEGRIYDYGARFNAVPHPWLWWKDMLAQAAYGSREQMFVRISSPNELGVVWRDPDFQTVLAGIAALGLYAENTSR
jgi:hypothetical protein